MKILILIFCALCTLTLTAQTYSGGSGTESDPYRISSKTDMAALATAVNVGNSYSGKYFLLTQDIIEEITTVIGNYMSSNRPFSGVFDGNGHSVTLNIQAITGTTQISMFAGVFGYISNALIKNLKVIGNIYSKSSQSSYSGGICGLSNGNSEIFNCYFAGGKISSDGALGGVLSYSGGICGTAGNLTKISNCIVSEAEIITDSGRGSANRIVGSGSPIIEYCYASSLVLVDGRTISSDDHTSKEGKDSSTNVTIDKCSHIQMDIVSLTNNTLKWQRSSNNDNSWEDITCTLWYYTEADPPAGHYFYRAQNGDGTFSPYVEVTYSDAIPATINTLPLTGATKTVDESITLSLELQDDNYNYQWYKDNAAITGATSNSYSIPVVKSANGGVYKCKVWNGCNEIYSEASTLTVNKCPQVITFPEISVKTYGDETITLPDKTDKGLTITYQSVNTNVATVSGNVLTLKNPGTSTIIASQAGDADYLLAPAIERTLTVNKQAQTITFGEIATKRYGDPAITLPATTDKGLAISYQVINTNVATAQGNTVTILNSGSTDIIASQAGDDYCYAATPVTQTLTVQKANQSITFANFDAKTYGDPNIVLNQYSDAGLEITYTSDNEDVATINGNTVVLHNTGSVQITATQNGNGNYNAAPPITRTLVIGKAGQTIVWDNIEPKTYGDDDFYLPASSDKGLNIVYSVANENIATVTGNKVHITGAGTTGITASQTGNNNFFPASSVTLTLTVSKVFQTISFNELADKTYGDPSFELESSVNSGLPVTFESSNTGVATVSGNILTIVNAGTAYITASVAGNNNYYSANPVQQQLIVNKANQSIALDFIPDKTYGDGIFTLNAYVNTGLPVTYLSSDPGKLLISGNHAFIFGAGSFTVTATQSGNNNYLPVSDSKTFVVKKANLTVSAENKERYYGDENPVLTYTFIGFVDGDSKVDLHTLPVIVCPAVPTSSVGYYPISVSGAADDNYNFIFQNAQLTINKAPLTVKPNDVSRKYGDSNPTFVIAYSGFKNGENESVLPEKPLAVTNAKATSDVGVYDIFASGGAANNYEFTYQTGKLTIDKALLNVIVDNKQREYGNVNSQFTYSLTGFKNDDSLSDIDVLPVVFCSASQSSPVGEYDIITQGASDNNYVFSYFNGKLTIVKAPLTITAENKQRKQGEENPPFTLLYSGFKNNENASVLAVLPTIYCAADVNSPVGTYDIVLLGGSDNNYSYNLINGKLDVLVNTGIAETERASSLKVYPNPTRHLLYIQSDAPVERVEIYSQSGACVLINTNVTDKLDVSGLANGTYLARIYVNGIPVTKKIMIKK